MTLDTKGADVRLLDEHGADATDNVPGDGSCVSEVQLVDNAGNVIERFSRNEWGTFFQVYQPNKWQAKRLQLQPSVVSKETLMA